MKTGPLVKIKVKEWTGMDLASTTKAGPDGERSLQYISLVSSHELSTKLKVSKAKSL